MIGHHVLLCSRHQGLPALAPSCGAARASAQRAAGPQKQITQSASVRVCGVGLACGRRLLPIRGGGMCINIYIYIMCMYTCVFMFVYDGQTFFGRHAIRCRRGALRSLPAWGVVADANEIMPSVARELEATTPLRHSLALWGVPLQTWRFRL